MVEQEPALALKARKRVYNLIKRSPGLHFRELKRRLKLATGQLQYHLSQLQEAHLVRAEKDGRFTRYYAIRGEQLGESEKTLSLLRQDSVRRIVLFLQGRRFANNLAISNAIELSPSTTPQTQPERTLIIRFQEDSAYL